MEHSINSNILNGQVQKAYVITLFLFFVFILFTNKTFTFFIFLFIIGFYSRYISKYKTFIGRSRTPATPKMEIFVKENNGVKPLIINTKFTVLDVTECL